VAPDGLREPVRTTVRWDYRLLGRFTKWLRGRDS